MITSAVFIALEFTFFETREEKLTSSLKWKERL